MIEAGAKVLPFKMSERILLRRIRQEAVREAQLIYRLTAGFTDPCPPDPEMRRLFEEGMVEL